MKLRREEDHVRAAVVTVTQTSNGNWGPTLRLHLENLWQA